MTGLKAEFRIAHFVQDQKFIDSAWSIFEISAPKSNFLFLPSNKNKSSFIKKAPVIFVKKNSFSDKVFLERLKGFDIVVFHSLTEYSVQLVKYLAKLDGLKPKIVWIGMGYDYLDLMYKSRFMLLTEKSRKLAYRFCDKCFSFKSLLRYFKFEFKFNLNSNEFFGIDFFSPVLELEYLNIKKSNPNFHPKYVSWNYPDAINLIENNNDLVVNGNNILLGNSATLTNNHIDILDYLSCNINLNSNVICPLSYGEKDYAQYIVKYGKKKLGDSFKPLLNFIAYEKYIDFISSCSVVIMNHKRQQGAGNVIAMIFLGATVFLNKNNPLYEHFIELGVVLYTIEDLELDPGMLSLRLTPDQIKNNKKIIKSIYGRDAMVRRTQDFITRILSA